MGRGQSVSRLHGLLKVNCGKSEARKEKGDISYRKLSKKDKDALIERMTKEMKDAARRLEFEQAAFLRDKIKEIRESK